MQLEEDIQLLNEARAEIQSLRRSNELLTAKVDVMEAFMCVLNTQPANNGNRAASVDIAWELGKRIKQKEEEIKSRPQAAFSK